MQDYFSLYQQYNKHKQCSNNIFFNELFDRNASLGFIKLKKNHFK